MLKTMENIIANSKNMKQTIHCLKTELNILKKSYSDIRIKKLTQENVEITKQVEEAKCKLIQLETAAGIKQVPIPSINYTEDDILIEIPKQTTVSTVDEPTKLVKKDKAKKAPIQIENEGIHIGRLDLRVGQIMQVEKHPDADSLYVSKIKCGDTNVRTVVSGLVKFISIDELQNRKVLVLCNLKPAKMRGVLSEAMVMCASSPEAVEVLNVPDTSEPGDLIICEGFERQPDAQLNPKKKIFEAVAVDLKTNDSLEACYKGKVLSVSDKGIITSKSLKNINIK